MRKKEEWSHAYVVERGRTRDTTMVTCSVDGNKSLPSRVGNVMYSSLEPAQTQPQNTMPSSRIDQTLSNDMICEIKNGSFSVLDPLKSPLWSMLSWRPCWYWWSTAPGCVKLEIHVDVRGLGC